MSKQNRFSRFSKPIRNQPARLEPSLASMDKLLKQCGVTLDRGKLEKLWTFHTLLRKRNQDRDLTRIIGFENTVFKHYVDSMIVADLTHLTSPIVDIGTGAGFPGIPLKIRLPSLHVILAEHRPRRCAFLREAIQLLGLQGIEVFEHKVTSQSFQTSVQGVITRALEEIPNTLLRTSLSLEKGGKLYFLKGPNVEDELKEVARDYEGRFKLVEDKAYTLAGTPYDRRLIVYEKLIDKVYL